jgi:AAA15 family ATPase/GTPase
MPPLKHIQLRPHKGLKDATLSDLEKINVVCGPNNSDKTTVAGRGSSARLHP